MPSKLPDQPTAALSDAAEVSGAAVGSDEIVVLGRLLDPYGVRGWMHLHPFGDDPLSWRQIDSWLLGPEQGPWRPVGLSGLKVHGDGLVVSLADVADRSAAEALKGRFLAVARSALPQPAADEFYWADLIGLRVINTAGEYIGRVQGLIETGANDVLRVLADDGEERLLPFVAAVVLTVDREKGEISVDWGLDW